MRQLTHINGIQLAYSDTGGDKPPLVLLHGLTTNALQFGGLMRAGLAEDFRVVIPDLRGRGASDKPPTGYTMPDHAADITGLLEALDLTDITLAGHSFGGMLTLYMGANCPNRLARLVMMDAAKALAHPSVLDAIQPVLKRLEVPLPSTEEYLARLRALPIYAGAWDDDMEALYRADVEQRPDGRVQSRSTRAAIRQASEGVIATDWDAVLEAVVLPSMLIRATAPYGERPLLSAAGAHEMLDGLPNAVYHEVGGNHTTMIFGERGVQVANHIRAFAGVS